MSTRASRACGLRRGRDRARSTPSETYATPRARQRARSGQGVPPSADSRIAFIPQVGASTQEIGRTQSGRSTSGTRKPPISQTGYSKRFPSAQAARKRTNETANRKPSAPKERTVPTIENSEGELVLDGQVDAEDEAAEEERRDQAVDPDRAHRERDREEDEGEVRRGGDERLERPVPPLPLHRAARGRARRRPHAHHRGTEGCVEERLRISARAKHQECDGREEERPDDLEEALEGRAGDRLELEVPAEGDEPERLHSSEETSAT